MLIAINYHYIRPVFDHPYPGIYGVTPVQFERQLRMLSRGGTFVSAVQLRDAIRGVAELPEKSIIVTFDDGLREQYEHAWPVLLRLGVPAIFFVNTAPIAEAKITEVHKIHLLRSYVAPEEFLRMLHDQARNLGVSLDLHIDSNKAAFHYKYDSAEVARLKYLLNFLLTPRERSLLIETCFRSVFPEREAEMSRALYFTKAQLAELGAHRCLGTHAHEHVPLGLLPFGDAREQLRRSVALLEDWGGDRPIALSYPYGSQEACSLEVATLAAQEGIKFAFTMERAGNPELTMPLFLARFDNNDLPGGKASSWTVDTLFEAVTPARWYRQ